MKSKYISVNESENQFDYTQIKFPTITSKNVNCEESDGNIYYFTVDGFEKANESILTNEDSLITFVVEAEAYGQWYGNYRPATRYEPEEYPEYEITDSSAYLDSIEDEDSSVVKWFKEIPTKEQAIKDGNEKWYNEYEAFVKILTDVAEEMECDRLLEDPPEPDDDYDDDDYDDDGYYQESIESVDGNIKTKALQASKILGMIAYLGDIELDKKQKMLRMQKNIKAQEMADAIDDIKAYREEAKKLTPDRKRNSFAGSTQEYSESHQRGQKSQREIFASIIELVSGDIINPDEYVLHHIDGSHANNKINNLSLVKKELHNKLHMDAKRNVGLNPNQKIDGLGETQVNDYSEELINLFKSKVDGVNYISIPINIWATIQNNIRNSKPDAEDLNPRIDVAGSHETHRMLSIKRHVR